MADSTSSFVAEADLSVRRASAASRLGAYGELLKPGISAFVVSTAIAGYLLGVRAGIDWGVLLGLIAGTGLTAGGSGTLNHVIESGHDAKMVRTRSRPLPTGRIGQAQALVYGLGIFLAGAIVLALSTNGLTVALAMATGFLYVAVYTPAKRRTPQNTFIGAVPGALPILGGYAAATASLGALGWVAFAVLYLWQLPHFFALAWMYRDDYAAGGFKMLPNVDPTGRKTGRTVLFATLLLLVVSLLPVVMGAVGLIYLLGMLAVGAAFVAPAFEFHRDPDFERARRLLRLSLVYVPVFFTLVVVDFLLR